MKKISKDSKISFGIVHQMLNVFLRQFIKELKVNIN
jgi:hypothetical protein